MDLPRTHTAVDCRPAELVAVYMEIISMNTQSSASRVPRNAQIDAPLPDREGWVDSGMAVEISWVWPGSSRRVPEVAGSSHDDQSVSAKRGAPSKSNVRCCFHPGKYGDTPRVSEGAGKGC